MPAEERVDQHDSIVVAAGEGPGRAALPAFADEGGATVIAADGGLDRALALGLRPRIVLGDHDSVSAEALARAERDGARVIRHPPEKNATDLELALAEAQALGARRVLVIASAAGRLDHLLSALLLLGSEPLGGLELDALVGDAAVHVVRGERVLAGRPGDLLTLLALHGPATGVTTEGLAYPLRGATLMPGSSRGVSNVFDASEARVTLEDGVLLAIRPGAAP
jgi:thiamine pyrophosphokinase